MQTMTTNEVFHHLILLLRIHKDKEFLLEIFESQYLEISKAKIDSWSAKDPKADKYREMPRAALDAFISELYKRRLVE